MGGRKHREPTDTRRARVDQRENCEIWSEAWISEVGRRKKKVWGGSSVAEGGISSGG